MFQSTDWLVDEETSAVLASQIEGTYADLETLDKRLAETATSEYRDRVMSWAKGRESDSFQMLNGSNGDGTKLVDFWERLG